MKNQLSNITVQYRKFSKGQYLEDPDQFNEFLDSFEDQDRLSRVLLQGVGIVCGFKPKLIYKNRLLDKIQLSQGAAVTTDGDLLTLNNTSEVSKDLYVSDLKTINIEKKEYTHFKSYDNFKIKYPSFYEGTEQIELWELATAQEARTDFQPINALSDLEDKYLLLYLEDYEKDVKPCRGVDCDNHGVQQIRNLKVLVTTANGITHILGSDRFVYDPVTNTYKPGRKDRLQPHPLFIEGIMEPVKQQRVILEQFVSDRAVRVSDLKNQYIKAVDRDDYGRIVFERIREIGNVLGIPTADHGAFKASFTKIFNQDSGFQYAYDVVKDLMDTYSEIIELLPKAFTKDLFDLLSFPKHIMLGKLISNIQLDSTRHQFYNSPVLDNEKATQRVKVLIDRFNQQVYNFNYANIFENKGRVKITPSQKLNPLSNKAIPFYYRVTEGLLKVWNFDKTSNRSFKDNLAYDTDLLASGPNAEEDSLNFNIDRNPFYNIEGHQGLDYETAFEQIDSIRNKMQLGFDIMLLSLEELVGNKDLSKAYFNEYIEKNSGLEHQRGVKRGGTFIMVYDSIRNPKVIADFSLPYICCTPKAVVKLSLPASAICAEASPIPFTVSPMNGIVKASVGSGVKLINGQYFFDPKAVEEQYRGQEITFTVNGKPTDCSIKVVSQPEIKIEVVNVYYPEGESVITELHLKVSGDGFENYTYSWDFLNNGHFITRNPDASGNVSYTFYNLEPKNIPTVKVNVSGNGCTENIAIEDWYDAPVSLSLPSTVICSRAKAIPFKMFPESGTIRAYVGTEEVKNVIIPSENGYSFHPGYVGSTLYGQYITFTVDYKATNCRIRVIPPPSVNLNYTVDYPANGSAGTIINIAVSGDYATDYFYEWDFLGNGAYTNPEPIVNGKISYQYTSLDLNKIPVIKVKVTGGGCTQNIDIKDWYDVPVRLSLATEIICVGADPIRFTDLFPANGTIEAHIGTDPNPISGVILSPGDGYYYFDPNKVNQALYGQYITFTVNGKSTNCRIKVVLSPNVDIVVKSVDYVAGNPTQTTVNLEVSGPDFANYNYSWDFMGIDQFTPQNLTGNKLSYTYTNLDSKSIPAINVKVSNGGCTQFVTIRNWYVVIKDINLSGSANCCPVTKPDIKADAGVDMRFSLSSGKFGLKGSAEGPPQNQIQYFWSKLKGPNVRLITDPSTSDLFVEDIVAGSYLFQLMAKHTLSGAFSIDTAIVTVY